MARVIRVDPEVRDALDRIRERYGDTNYADAVRRVLRWKRITASSETNQLPGLRRWL